MSMFKGDVGGVMPPSQTSAPQNTAVGSGSRPGPNRINIPTSAPSNAHTRGAAGRDPLK